MMFNAERTSKSIVKNLAWLVVLACAAVAIVTAIFGG
jgi:hypothetical protein